MAGLDLSKPWADYATAAGGNPASLKTRHPRFLNVQGKDSAADLAALIEVDFRHRLRGRLDDRGRRTSAGRAADVRFIGDQSAMDGGRPERAGQAHRASRFQNPGLFQSDGHRGSQRDDALVRGFRFLLPRKRRDQNTRARICRRRHLESLGPARRSASGSYLARRDRGRVADIGNACGGSRRLLRRRGPKQQLAHTTARRKSGIDAHRKDLVLSSQLRARHSLAGIPPVQLPAQLRAAAQPARLRAAALQASKSLWATSATSRSASSRRTTGTDTATSSASGNRVTTMRPSTVWDILADGSLARSLWPTAAMSAGVALWVSS